MTKIIIVLFAILLILSGGVLLLVPREEPQRAATRGASPQVISLIARAREIAEQVNAPLSILFGLGSLYYSRRRYIAERDNGRKPG